MKKYLQIISILCVCISLSYGLEVKKGWNFIGVEEKTSIKDIKQKYSDIDKILIFEDNNYKDVTNSDDLHINPTDGMFIRTDKDFNIDSKKDINPQTTIQVKKGWNLKSISINTPILARSFGSSVRILTYSATNSKWYKYPSNRNLEIEPMQGFFIYSPNDTTYDLKKLSQNLQSFDTKADMNDYLEEMIISHKMFRGNNNYPQPQSLENGPPIATVSTGKVSAPRVDNATSTNVQEAGIDEGDILKHDGVNIFYLQNSQLYISSFEKVLNNANSLQVLDVFKNTNIRATSIYLIKEKLIVLGRGIYPTLYRSLAPPPRVEDSFLYMQIYDVSDLGNILLKRDIKINGDLVNSRVVGNKIYLVSKFRPHFKVEYEKIYEECETIYQRRDKDGKCYGTNYKNYDILEKRITPYIVINDTKSELLKYDNLFAPTNTNQSLSIVTTTVFDIEDNAIDNISLMSNSNTVYMSHKSLYLVSDTYNFRRNPTTQTTIYKISLNDKLSFVDDIVLDGKAINQFAFSEHDNVLRVATTIGFGDNTDNMITTIKENNKELEKIGHLGGLGKKGETIKSVRFMGDKAFVVTFKRTDPFYTIDLSDASNPKKAGELHISGFSTYLQDIGNEQILALGNSADSDGRVTGMQIQLFDISDFTKPTLLDKYVFDKKTYSSALYQHKAFTYRASDKKFAIQVNSYQSQFYGFYVFKAEDKKIQQISIIENSRYSYNGRSVIFTLSDKDYILMLDKGLKVKEL